MYWIGQSRRKKLKTITATTDDGAEIWAITKGQEARLEVNEMRMLRWMCGVTRRDNIRNEHIKGTTRVVQASKKITEKRQGPGQGKVNIRKNYRKTPDLETFQVIRPCEENALSQRST